MIPFCSPSVLLSRTLSNPPSLSLRGPRGGGPLTSKTLAIKKSIPSTCSLQAPQQPPFETDGEAGAHKSAELRYLWPTWGKIYANGILESIYQALTEGLQAAGGGAVRVYEEEGHGWRRGREVIYTITHRKWILRRKM